MMNEYTITTFTGTPLNPPPPQLPTHPPTHPPTPAPSSSLIYLTESSFRYNDRTLSSEALFRSNVFFLVFLCLCLCLCLAILVSCATVCLHPRSLQPISSVPVGVIHLALLSPAVLLGSSSASAACCASPEVYYMCPCAAMVY